MKFTDCQVCGAKDVPLNDTLKVNGQVYCGACIESFFPNEKMLEGLNVERPNDPTVCAFCNTDFEGRAELKKLGAYPICEPCEIDVRNKAFPLWVKGFFAAVIAIIVFAFFWNWKYYTAYNDINNAWHEFGNGNYDKAASVMDEAVAIVPEVTDLDVVASYFKGLNYLKNDKSQLALNQFNYCVDRVPDEFGLPHLMARAKMGAAFDSKNYKGFLAESKGLLAIDSVSATPYFSVASAYACLYATEGADSLKAKSEEYMAKGIARDSAKTDADYVNTIEYRLYSRRIITREQFEKEFPKGWAKP